MQVSKYNTLIGHQDCIYHLTKNPRNTKFYSADGTGMVAMWDLANPEIGNLLAKVSNSVYSMDFWEIENILVVGQNFEGIHLIDVVENKEVKSLKLTENYIFCIKIIENTAFIGCGNGELLVVDLINMHIIQKIQLSDKSIRTLNYNAQKQHLAVGLSDFTVKILDISHQFILHKTLEKHTNSVFSVVYSPDGKYLLSAGRDAKINIWQTEDYTLHTHIPAHWFAVNKLVYSPDGRFFASGSMDKSVKIWENHTFKLVKVLDKSRFAGHGNSVNTLLWVDNFLLSGGDDRQINIWEVK